LRQQFLLYDGRETDGGVIWLAFGTNRIAGPVPFTGIRHQQTFMVKFTMLKILLGENQGAQIFMRQMSGKLGFCLYPERHGEPCPVWKQKKAVSFNSIQF